MFYGNALPRCHRYSFPSLTMSLPAERGATVLLYPDLSVGVCSVWQQFEGDADPLAMKNKAWQWYSDSNAYSVSLSHAGISLLNTERLYTFVSVVADVGSEDLNKFCSDNAEELGRIFTGNYESEESAQLVSYIAAANPSRRRYERLFFRWTDALAIYSRDTDEYEYVMFRAAQVFETCILTRAILRSIKEKADQTASIVSAYLPRPWKVNRIIAQFAAGEKDFIVAPPVQSVETERLLRAAHDQFGIPKMATAMRESISYLEKRFQWSKTQFLAVIAIVLFVFDKVVPFKTIWPCVFNKKTSISDCLKHQLTEQKENQPTK
jgi:hypothetical protein